MTWLVLVLFALALGGDGQPAPDRAGQRRLDKSGAFSYRLPESWKATATGRFQHDLIELPSADGFRRNIVINDQGGTSTLEVLKAKYERDLARALKDFRLISSELVELEGKGPAVRIVHTNSMPGVPVRQVNYIVAIDGRRYFLACTVLEADGEKYDADFEAFVLSMKKPEE